MPRFRRPSRRLAAILRTESVGGALLVGAAIVALVIANSPFAGAYATFRDWQLGPESLGLRLSLGQWAADGLLAIFFFLAGLELKQEFVVGELRRARQAIVPIAAAVGGMLAPAAVYLTINIGNSGAAIGWAIPTATDIAFALAVLAVVGRALPGQLRTFLLTLAVVDDLLAIIVIAIFFTHAIHLGYLAGSLLAVAAFWLLVQRWPGSRATAVAATVVALLAWALMLRSGVHATVAGVLLAFGIPIVGRRAGSPKRTRYDEGRAGASPDAIAPARRPAPRIADRLDHILRPISAGIAVPLFAFFAAGVTVGGIAGLGSALGDRVTIGIAVGLVAGKAIGIFATTQLVGRLVRSPFVRTIHTVDLFGLSLLGGIGFTVSLLIGHLAFAGDATRTADAQIGIVVGSLVAAAIAGSLLAVRNRRYRLSKSPGLGG